MRNSEARRYARWSLAAAGLLAAVVGGVYGRNVWIARQAAKKAPPAVPSTIEQRSNEFSFSKVEGQRTIYTVRASRTTEFKEGSRNLLEDVAISVYGKKGERNDTLRTNACDFISNTGRMTCAGEIQISLQAAGGPSANSIQVATSAVTFDRESGQARTEKPLTFHWPGGDGRAVGMTYESDNGILRLNQSVELNLNPSDASASGKSGPAASNSGSSKIVRLAGSSMAFHRDARTIEMDGNVQARQAEYELAAQKLLVELDTAFEAKRFVASGSPQLRAMSPQMPLSLTSDEIVSQLRPDATVESVVASGNVHARRNTPAGGETIDAGRIQVALAAPDNTPRLLTASQGVRLTSTGTTANAGAQHVESDMIEIRFVTEAHTGQTSVDSINALAPARVDWQNVAVLKGKSVPQLTRMTGKQMSLKFGGQNQLQQLTGAGGVEVTRKLGDAPDEITSSRELIAQFDRTGQWSTIDQTGDVQFRDGLRSGQGQRARVTRAAGTVRLDGQVSVSDAQTRTTADSATFVQGSQAVQGAQGATAIRADGHVVTTDLHAGAGSIANLAPEPAHISADHFVADTARGHATYSGHGRLWQGQSVIEGNTIELDSPTHIVQVKGQVRGVFPQAGWSPKQFDSASTPSTKPAKTVSGKTSVPGGRSIAPLGHFRGGMLTYWDAESRGRIEQDAHVDAEQGSIQANAIDLYFSDGGAASGTKQLSRSVATGDVTVRQGDRKGTSQRAEYTASEGKFVLSEGNPTLYSSSGDTTTGRQLTFYFADDRIVVDSSDGSKTVTLHRVEK